MISPSDMASLQRAQYAHDMRNHFDILSLHKNDRLKHYGLHFAKYVGRLARGTDETKPVERTLVDAILVSLSTANTLHQDFSKESFILEFKSKQVDPLRTLADASGRFADACEKIDHMEDFLPIARSANRDIMAWLIREGDERNLSLVAEVERRRVCKMVCNGSLRIASSLRDSRCGGHNPGADALRERFRLSAPA